MVRNGKPKKGSKSDGMSCSKDGCGAYATGGGEKAGQSMSRNPQNVGGAKGLSMKPRYSSKVVNKEAAARKMEKTRSKMASSAPKLNRNKF